MAPMPVPPGPGGDDRVSGLLQQGLHLSDAARIAAARLDGAVGGSLKEALAITVVDDAADAAAEPAVATGTDDARLASGPLVRLIETASPATNRLRSSKPLDAFSPMPAPPLDLGVALVAPVHSAPPSTVTEAESAQVGGPVLEPSEDWQGFATSTPAPAAAMPSQVAATHGAEPLASALDAAARLAADASVAAEALENLKRMLEHKQRLESQLLQRATSPGRAPASPPQDAAAHTPMSHAPVRQPLPPLPLPLHADAGGGRAVAVLPPPRPRPPADRRGFDVRGFMAGFALSWAFGVVLYFFMTAG